MEKYDVAVIGAGPGGYPAAIRSAQLGARVAIVEKEKLGGTCLNWGCIPTKAMIASAGALSAMRNAADMGIRCADVEADVPAVFKRKDRIVAKLGGGIAQLLKANKIDVIEGEAAFDSRNRLAVKRSGKTERIEAGKTIIATGSSPVIPGFLKNVDRVEDSRAFLERSDLPAKIIVLGAGVIGCEFACMCAGLGVKVTLVELLNDILPFLDKDIRREVGNHMKKQLGIQVITGAPLEAVKSTGKSIKGKAGDSEIKADILLCAIGRAAFTDGLALDKAEVRTDDKGRIIVDEFLQTTASTVYAVGDATGGQLAHEATSQAVAAAQTACGDPTAWKNLVVPSCIFTAPEIGVVGLTEQAAAESEIDVETGMFSFAASGKAMASGEASGFVKWLAEPGTGRLLGAKAVGPHATELIAEATLAIQSEQTAEEVGNVIHSHPTLSEAWMEAAHAVNATCIHAPPARRQRK